MSEFELKVYEVVPAGLYSARVQEVKEEQGNWGAYLKITFLLQTGAMVTGCASAKFSTKSKLYKWVKSILLDGQPAPKGFVLRTNDLIGRYCMVQVAVDVDKEGDKFNTIEAVYSPQRAAAPAAAPAPAPTMPEQPPSFFDDPNLEPPAGF